MRLLTESEFLSLADDAELSPRDRGIVASVLVDGRMPTAVASAYNLSRQYVDRRVAAFIQRVDLDTRAATASLLLSGVPVELRADVVDKVAAYVAEYLRNGSAPRPRSLGAPVEHNAPWQPLPEAATHQRPKPVKPPRPQSARAQKAAMQRAIADARNGLTVQPPEQQPPYLEAFADWDEVESLDEV